MNETESIGSRIIRARAALGLSQADLAGQMGVAPTQFARWEKGKATPRAETLHKLASVLNVSPLWLERGEGHINAHEYPELPSMGEKEIETLLSDDELRLLRARARASGRELGEELSALAGDFLRDWAETRPPPGHMKLAMPDQLQARLSQAAEKNGRTLNDEIIERLSSSADLARLHNAIADLSDALAEERARRKRELRVVFKAFEEAVEQLSELVEEAEREGSDERYNELQATYNAQLSKLNEIEWYIDADNPHLKEL